MDTLLLPITPEVLKKLFSSDDLTSDFINNKAYSSSNVNDRNIINVANVLLSYYMHMNRVNGLLTEYASLLKKGHLSPPKKDDIQLRIQLLTYVQSQKSQLDSFDSVNQQLKEAQDKIKELQRQTQGRKMKKSKTKKSKRTRKTRESKRTLKK
jgi:hypothetical protein